MTHRGRPHGSITKKRKQTPRGQQKGAAERDFFCNLLEEGRARYTDKHTPDHRRCDIYIRSNSLYTLEFWNGNVWELSEAAMVKYEQLRTSIKQHGAVES